MVKTLDELAIQYKTDKATIYPGESVHGYAPIYDRILTPLRDKPIKMLEIGVCMEGTEGGHSILMWNNYFTKANIHTFDIVDMSSKSCIIENDNVFFYQGDQSNREHMKNMYQEYGNTEFDFILEDGSHEHNHQMISLGHLFKYVKSGGYYILEDMSIPEQPACCIRNDETYKIIQQFKETGKIVSEHLLPKEIDYLEKQVKSIEIHHDIQNAYAVAIITKK
jgi:demethylmacrocin O-methyltransferase